MARGYASPSPDNRTYLEQQPGVSNIHEGGGVIEFEYDPKLKPNDESVPAGVFFTLEKAPF